MINTFKRFGVAFFVTTFLLIPFLNPFKAYAATSPNLGDADSFVILSGTYTNTVGGTTLAGDLGYTTGPAMAPTVNGNTHTADSTYNQAGIDQGSALTALNNQPCSFTFAPGAVDLASNVDFPTSTYTPGVYCINGAATIGGGGTITLNGTGTYIFRMDGALDTSASSIVALAAGASGCNVWWTPNAATTLGANSTFLGNVVDPSGITIGSTVTWIGRALAFGGTVSTDVDTISANSCFAVEETPGLPDTSTVSQNTAMPMWVFPIAALVSVGSLLLIVFKRKFKNLL